MWDPNRKRKRRGRDGVVGDTEGVHKHKTGGEPRRSKVLEAKGVKFFKEEWVVNCIKGSRKV